VDHSDPELLEAVRQGRRREFAQADWAEAVADPADPATFAAAVLDPSVAAEEPHRSILAAHTELLRLRRRHAVLHDPDAEQRVERHGEAVVVRRALDGARTTLIVHLGRGPATVPLVDGDLDVAFDSGQPRWHGSGGPAELDGGALRLTGPSAVLLIS
jgi:maltooligosyltrehalose trehalohydrolase